MKTGLTALALTVAVAAGAQNLSFGTRAARETPEWMNRLTLYELWLGAFSPAGTLAGATPGLKRIADLGANVVYLGPIAKRSARPHASPYNVADYDAIDPDYGSPEDLKAFVAEAHRLGLKVMLDVVYYHAAPDSVLMKDPSFFMRDEAGRVVRGFWPQPLPDFAKPEVRRTLAASLAHWVREFDVDGFRCDVAAGVPIAFWEEARDQLDRVKPNVILLSEADRLEDQLKAFDLNYNFRHYLTLRSVLRDGDPAIRIREHWEQTRRRFPRGARFLHYTDNHDWRRPVVEFGDKASMVASVLNFTLDGIPMIYNGQEIGDRTPLRWTGSAPIPWEGSGIAADRKESAAAFTKYKALFRMRNTQPALTSGELVWIDNSEPDSVLSFIRKKGNEEILVILNLSNRKLEVALNLPVMEYYKIDNLLKDGQTWFELYSGRVSAKLAAFEDIVGKRVPHEPLER